MKNVGSGLGWGTWVLSLSVVYQSGCLPPPRGTEVSGEAQPPPTLPARIQPPSGVAPVSTPEQVQTLIKELKHSELATDSAYVAPEQIVAMAATRDCSRQSLGLRAAVEHR